MNIKYIKNFFLFKIIGYYLIISGIVGVLNLVIGFIGQFATLSFFSFVILITFLFIIISQLYIGLKIKDFQTKYLTFTIILQILQCFALYSSNLIYEFSSFIGIYMVFDLNTISTGLTITMARLRVSFISSENQTIFSLNFVPFILLFLISRLDKNFKPQIE